MTKKKNHNHTYGRKFKNIIVQLYYCISVLYRHVLTNLHLTCVSLSAYSSCLDPDCTYFLYWIN